MVPYGRSMRGQTVRRSPKGEGEVEAGGVEPPSEKRCAAEPTCLSQFAYFRQPRSERARNTAS